MRLGQLMEGLGLQLPAGSAELPVADLTDDSRQVRPGSLFLARAGTQEDGRRFIADAVARGAVAVVAQGPSPADQAETSAGRVPLILAPRVDQAFAGLLAERFFDQPSRKLRLIGITGTKGKTTTAFLIQHLLNRAGVKCGMIGTVYLDDGATRQPASLTTPGAIDFTRHLAAMAAHGCRAAVAEFSSQALHQGRTDALRVDVAVFTNLTGDHLDYHKTMEAYAAAKARLFESLAEQAFAVVNMDDEWAGRMLTDCRARKLLCRVATGQGAAAAAPPGAAAHNCLATVLELAGERTTARFEGPWGSVQARYPLVGRHNVINVLQAVAAANCLATEWDDLAGVLAEFPGVPGRLEKVVPAVGEQATPDLPTVLVDYAHTHDSLRKVLEALRPLAQGPARLICLFGCGGDRDAGKRPKMAAAACDLADLVVITSDNPRTEDPARILRDILAGVPGECPIEHRGGDLGAGGRKSPTPLSPSAMPGPRCQATDRPPPAVLVQPDRAAAIDLAIDLARPGDLVLLAGKGHEDYQIIGTTKRHFDDREQAAAALARKALRS